MRQIIQDFPNHIEHAIQIAESISLNVDMSSIKNIVISGQGGSAIGGVIAKNILFQQLNIPVIVNRNYTIPSFVNHSTLFISSSYSGNTEETLSALQKAEEKKSIIFCVTSGGALLGIAQNKSYDHIVIPSGGAPRAMLCYSVVQLLFILAIVSGISTDELKIKLLNVKNYLLDHQKSIIHYASDIVSKISNKMPFIYTFSEFEGVALRFKQQLNENSKRHACYNIIPEMNHNEIVPWVKKNACVIPIFLNGESFIRNKKRMDINMSQISQSVDHILELKIDNNNYFIQYFYFIHLLDWASLMIAENENVNPDDIDLIDSLKEKLKKNKI